MIISIKKTSSRSIYRPLNYFGKIQMSVNQVCLIIVQSREPDFSWLESQKVLLCFSISPHNEGNNKHGCNDVPVQIRSGREGGEGLGGRGLEGRWRETHIWKSIFMETGAKEQLQSRAFFFSSETQRCCIALGETSSINSAGIVSCCNVLNT